MPERSSEPSPHTTAGVVGLDHVQVSCPPGGEDAQRAFYVQVLGMHEVPKPPKLAVRGGAWFRGGGCEIHVGVEQDFRPARKAHPAIAVDGLAVLAERVEAAGFPVRWDDSIEGVRRLHTADGAGNRVELVQVGDRPLR